MVRWREFESEAPDIAARARELIERCRSGVQHVERTGLGGGGARCA